MYEDDTRKTINYLAKNSQKVVLFLKWAPPIVIKFGTEISLWLPSATVYRFNSISLKIVVRVLYVWPTYIVMYMNMFKLIFYPFAWIAWLPTPSRFIRQILIFIDRRIFIG